MCELKPIECDFIEEFGEAYVRSGYPRLMGRIVGLLMTQDDPISLDGIASQLEVSKGPVSQIANRLRDNQLIVRSSLPGDRKDYYKIHPGMFGNAFKSLHTQVRLNHELACKYGYLLEGKNGKEEAQPAFQEHLGEMAEFYDLMQSHFQKFIDEWQERKA